MATDNLRQVLEGYEQERIQLGVTFLNQALVAATLNDNHECIGKLIKMGAKNIDECIQLAKEKGVINATAMLMLLKAALTGDKTLLYVFQTGNASLTPEFAGLNLTRQVNSKIAQAVRSHTISTIHVLEVAQQSGQHSVVQELLLLTRTNELIGSVNWSNLHLVSMDRCLVHRMCNWVTALNLSSNKLRSIPAEIEILTKICSVDLNDNNLTNIPASLLQLPNLQMLDLSHNKITHLPDTPQWSTTLSEFNLSDNCLSSLSMNVSASSLMYLNLSKNQFRSVPLCICTFTTLISLDISDNPKIKNLPYELSMLTKLEQLNLNGLKRLKEPPKVFTRSPQKCISYLRSKFSDGSHCIQLMIVGDPGSGKHTLVSRLQNRELGIRHECNSRIYVNEWECRPNITKRVVHFRTWIFNSLEDYTSTHNCFLLQRSLYLLLFNLKCGSKGIHEIKVWLESITHHVPYSSVMIVGTHVDEMSNQDYRNSDFLLQQAKIVAAVYEHKLETIGLFQVGLKKTVTQLLDDIYSYAVNYPLLQLERAIIYEIGTSGERVEELLNRGKGKLDVQFLNEALEFATQMDSDISVGKVALAGPVNFKQCIMLAEREGKHHAHVMLLMIMAAISGDKEILNHLHLEPAYEDYTELLSLVHCGLFSVNVSVNVPIEIAQQNNKIQVIDELLMKTNVNPEEGYVYWIGLQLRELYKSLLRKIYWVKKLRLARNKLTALPQEMGEYLKQVVKIDFQHNDLATIPGCLLELPSLGELNISSNKLQEIPVVPKWSPCLTVLDLSNNQLSSLPSEVKAPAIRSLNIAKNKFHAVPLCVCSFTTLHSLTLSDNPNIVALPVQMGRLRLARLDLSGLKNLKEPPKKVQKECRECIRYLNSKLRSSRRFYHMKLMVLGYSNRGKTTLVARLQGKVYTGELRIGLDISEWYYSPSIGRRAFHFSIWDFAGQEEYAIHRCFLSQRSLYLLLFNLKHGDKGVEELRPWLNNLVLRAPRSCVIIIGTHLDEIPDEKRGEIDALLHRVGDLAASYNNRLQIMEVLPVGLKNHIENIGLLKEAIYNYAANYKNRANQLIMGQKIPATYHALVKQFEIIQGEVRQGVREPIMHVEEFKTMIHQMNLSDIEDDEELGKVTLFLTDVGSLLHFDDRGHNLHELYFVDPCWLCDLMAKIAVTIRPFVKNGILYFEDIPMLFKSDKQFPWQYFKQFLTLLDRFEIALALDNRRVLIPSILPGERPKELIDEKSDKEEPTYSRFIIFSSPTPPGFWSRLLSRIIHSIPIISYALDKSTSGSQPVPSSYYFDPKEIHLEYWRTGLYYKDQDVMFRIESLLGSKQFKRETKDGILVIATTNNSGKKIICQLIDLVLSLVGEWYPRPVLQEGEHGSSGLEQRVSCFECLKLGRAKPFEFKVEQCLQIIAKNETTMECGYFHDDPTKNHMVSLGDIVPDLLLQDIDSRFLLNAEEIDYDEDNTSLLGKGRYGKVYRGKCKGKSVAIKKYLSPSVKAICEVREEAIILQQLCHPCIVNLIGVCVQPLCALVLEEAPLRSLEFPLLKKMIPIHRLTIFRIAAEVAAALSFMHSQGIIKRGVKAADILLWTLDPDSLCHCKLCDFGISTHLSPIGVRGLQGSKTFIAPEVLHIGKRKQRSTYDHRADIFSFGMFLYQMIARRHPYHNIPPHRIDVAIESGERPKLQDVHISHTGYHYLTKVMKICWEDNPNDRFDTNTIIKKLCQLQIQMVMCVRVIPVKRQLSLHRATAITPANFAKAGCPDRLQSELWVCCDGQEGTEVYMFNIHTMVEINHTFIKDNQVQCMALCGDQVWLGSRSGIEYGVIDIFSIGSRETTHNIRVHESQSVTCITATDKAVYMGTLEGYCYSYSVQANIQLRCKYISEYAIDSIVCTQQYVWIAHGKYIFLLNFDSLSIECCVHRKVGKLAYIGQLSFDSDHNIIWSAHLGGVVLSAWDAHNKCHIYDVNTGRHLERVSDSIDDADSIMTAMTPALDTVWVGMASGHIMVFHEEELLSWFHPYVGYVRFLTCIPSAGPCGLEKAMVASGGKQFRPLVEGLDEDSDKSSSSFESGTLIIWEAYEAKTMKQMKLIEQNSPGYHNNHNTLRRMIQQGGFKDGTHIMHNLSTDIADRKTPPPGQSFEDSVNVQDLSESPIGSFTESLISSNYYTDLPSLQARVRTSCEEEATFNIKLPDSEQSMMVRCSKPVRLKVLNSEVEVTLARDECPLMYYKDGKAYRLQNQENLDEYLRLPKKPQLCIENADSEIIPKIYHATDKSSEEEVNVKIVDPIEQNLKLTCSKPAQLDSLLNEIISLGNLKSQKFNVMYLASNSEIEVNTQEDFDDYLALSNRPPLLVKLEQNMSSSNFNEDFELNCTASSTAKTSKIPSETTEDVTLYFKVFDSEYTLDMTCTKPLRLEAVLKDLKLIANLGDREWQLVYSVDESYVKIETQEDFEKYLSSASMPTLQITNDGF